MPKSSRGQRAPRPDAAATDARYGLEPLIEPEAGGGLGEFASVDCPYCGERYQTAIDLSAGAFCYIEDCQICCQPIELSGAINAAGGLSKFSARRLD